MKKLLPLLLMCLFGASAFAQQSLGDIAREIRAKKRASTPAVRLDDDTTSRSANTEPSTPATTTPADATAKAADATAKADDKAADAKSPDDKSADAKPAEDKTADAKPADVKAADATEPVKKDSALERKQKGEELKKQISDQKQQIALLQRELEVSQREGRLRAAAYYADAGTMLRDQAKFAEDSRKQQAEIDAKKQALESGQQRLTDLQEEARKAGLPPSD
jgi:hypothetical protein